VLVLSGLPGTVSRALLLVPREDSTVDDTDPAASDVAQPDNETRLALPKSAAGLAGLVAAEPHPFAPPPGSFAARSSHRETSCANALSGGVAPSPSDWI
jgi:hypothetical protein